MKKSKKAVSLILIIAMLFAGYTPGVTALSAQAAENGRQVPAQAAAKNSAPESVATGGADVVDFSENNMLAASFLSPTGYVGNIDDGGTVDMAAAYFASWAGPVYEVDDPYPSPAAAANVKLKTGLTTASHVSDIIMIPHTDTNNIDDIPRIKQAVYDYGAAYVSIQYNSTSFLNSSTHAYYMPQSTVLTSNWGHAVTIVGWDDNYSKANFISGKQPSTDGAFIIKNSYGATATNDGYFYISYEDKCIGKNITVGGITYKSTTAVFVAGGEADAYDHNYQYDQYGYTGSIAAGIPEYYYMANKFVSSGVQTLQAISFYTNGYNVPFEVYVVKSTGADITLPAKAAMPLAAASGIEVYPGYHTVKLNSGIKLAQGERFAVIVRIPGASSDFPVCVEKQFSNQKAFSALAGESFVMTNSAWTDLKSSNLGNLCIKAFTNDTATGGVPEDEESLPAIGESDLVNQPLPGESEIIPGESEQDSVLPDNSSENEPVQSGSDEELTFIERPSSADAADEDDAPPTGGTQQDGFVPGVKLERDNLYTDEGAELVTGAALPTKFDLRTSGIITSVKNQGGIGACWTFAAIASAESTYIKSKGMTNKEVTLLKSVKYLRNSVADGISITAAASQAESVAAYNWQIIQGADTVTITADGATCTVKPKTAGAEGVAVIRCTVIYNNYQVALDETNVVVTDYGATADGTAAHPYEVNTPNKLALLHNFSGSESKGVYFKQTADINLSGIPSWTPIGNYSEGFAFEGNYNGGGYAVSNLKINRTAAASENIGLGLFNCVEFGTIENVAVNGVSITVNAVQSGGNYIIGGLAARADNAIVKNCAVTGAINVTLTGAGDCYTYIGGLMGFMQNTSVSRCSYTGNITQSGGFWSMFGGLVCEVQGGSIVQSYANTALTSKGQASNAITCMGGLAFEIFAASVSNCYAVSTISATNAPIESDGAGMVDFAASGDFSNCYASTTIKGTRTTMGAFFGFYEDIVGTTLTNCYYDKTKADSDGLNTRGAAVGALSGLTTDNLQKQTSFTSWDFSGIWALSSLQNGGMPIHKNPIVAATDISLSEETPKVLYRPYTAVLKPVFTPAYASPQPVSASVNTSAYLTIGTTGLITPKARGITNITFTSGTLIKTISMTVDDKKADINLDGTVDTAAVLTTLTNLLIGKPTTITDYYIYDINRSSKQFSAGIGDITLADLLALKQYQAGVREINP